MKVSCSKHEMSAIEFYPKGILVTVAEKKGTMDTIPEKKVFIPYESIDYVETENHITPPHVRIHHSPHTYSSTVYIPCKTTEEMNGMMLTIAEKYRKL